jgi:hypothetical protein
MLWEANEARMDKGKDARRRARNRAQKPGATRKIEDKRRKAPRHSKRWQDDGTGSF